MPSLTSIIGYTQGTSQIWPNWNLYDATTTTTSDTIWPSWANQLTATTATTTSATYTWTIWQQQGTGAYTQQSALQQALVAQQTAWQGWQYVYQARQETEEERRAREAQRVADMA